MSTPDAATQHELRAKVEEAGRMALYPGLFTPCELLAQLLAATRLAFEVAGLSEEETEANAIHTAIADYLDVPRPAQGQAA